MNSELPPRQRPTRNRAGRIFGLSLVGAALTLLLYACSSPVGGMSGGSTGAGTLHYLYVANDSTTANQALSAYSVNASGGLADVYGASCSSGSCSNYYGTAPAPESTRDIAISPNGDFLYVTNSSSTGPNGLSGYSIGPSGSLSSITSGTLTTGSGPARIAITPNGRFLYVTNSSSTGTNGLSAYSIGPTGALSSITSGTLTTGSGPFGIAISPNGKYLYVSNRTTANISAFSIGMDGSLSDLSGSSCGSGLPTNCFVDGAGGGTIATIATSPNGDYLYVLNIDSTAAGLSAYSIGTSGALTDVSGSSCGSGLPSNCFATGLTDPAGMTMNPNGQDLFLLDVQSSSAWPNVVAYSIGSGGTLTSINTSSIGFSYSGENPKMPIDMAIVPIDSGEALYLPEPVQSTTTTGFVTVYLLTAQGGLAGGVGRSSFLGGHFYGPIAVTP